MHSNWPFLLLILLLLILVKSWRICICIKKMQCLIINGNQTSWIFCDESGINSQGNKTNSRMLKAALTSVLCHINAQCIMMSCTICRSLTLFCSEGNVSARSVMQQATTVNQQWTQTNTCTRPFLANQHFQLVCVPRGSLGKLWRLLELSFTGRMSFTTSSEQW